MKKYYFRKGLPRRGLDPQTVGEFLETKFSGQDITAEQVVEVAKNPRAPIHKYFEWDDSVAAKEYRLSQARNLISALYIEIDNGSHIRAYENVYVSESVGKAYIDIDRVSENEDLWSQVVENAKTELKYWKTKYEQYRDYFPGIFAAIEKEAAEGSTNEKKQKTRSRSEGHGRPNTTNRN